MGDPTDDPKYRMKMGRYVQISYPQIKKDLQARRDMYMEMFGRGDIGYGELLRELDAMEPQLQEVRHWEAQQAWDAEQRKLHAGLRNKFRGWSVAQIREWFKNNPNYLGQGNPGFWNRKQPKRRSPSNTIQERYFGPDSPAFFDFFTHRDSDLTYRPIEDDAEAGVRAGGEYWADRYTFDEGGDDTSLPSPSPSGRYPITSSEQIERQERAEANLKADIAAQAEEDKAYATAAGRDSVNFVNAVEDYATDILKNRWTMDQVPEEYKEAVRAEIARRRAAVKRT